MQRVAAFVILLLGLMLLFRAMLAGWLLFLVLAAALGFGASTGAIGRWGYTAAVIFALLAIPSLLLRTVGLVILLVGKLLPVLLVLIGLYYLVKAFNKR